MPFPLSEVAARREDDEGCAEEELEAVMRALLSIAATTSEGEVLASLSSLLRGVRL